MLSKMQVRILGFLAKKQNWATREEIGEETGDKKGFSKALGAPTNPPIKPDSLEGRGFVERHGSTPPFQYRITPSGQRALPCGGNDARTVSDSPGREPIVKVNEALQGRDAAKAVSVFCSVLRGEYSYCFADAEPFVRDTVMEVFQGLVALTTEFQVFRGPRKWRGSTWHHPTYAISFNTLEKRHFCDFKPKVVAGGYFKMTFPLPRPGFLDRLLQGCQWTQRDQSSGSYVDVRLFADTPKERCEQLAGVADRVRRYYV